LTLVWILDVCIVIFWYIYFIPQFFWDTRRWIKSKTTIRSRKIPDPVSKQRIPVVWSVTSHLTHWKNWEKVWISQTGQPNMTVGYGVLIHTLYACSFLHFTYLLLATGLRMTVICLGLLPFITGISPYRKASSQYPRITWKELIQKHF